MATLAVLYVVYSNIVPQECNWNSLLCFRGNSGYANAQ